jgi:AcrR family transcriptional regulator
LAAADIARRTFFGYFKSKEEILHAAIDTGFIAALRTAFAGADRDERPFDAVRRKLPRLVSRFESKESIAVERLMRSTEELWARKQAIFLRLERNLFESCDWAWTRGGTIAVTRSLAAHVREAFETLKAGL